jgi:hypothetical protein
MRRHSQKSPSGHIAAISRRDQRPSFANVLPSKQQGRREGRAPTDAHGPRATRKHAAEPQLQPKSSGFPCAMVLRLIRDLPGDQALLSPSPARRVSVFASLAPASHGDVCQCCAFFLPDRQFSGEMGGGNVFVADLSDLAGAERRRRQGRPTRPPRSGLTLPPASTVPN